MRRSSTAAAAVAAEQHSANGVDPEVRFQQHTIDNEAFVNPCPREMRVKSQRSNDGMAPAHADSISRQNIVTKIF